MAIRISGSDYDALTEYINSELTMDAKSMTTSSGEQILITWRVPSNKSDCKMCGPSSKCFCGHLFKAHKHKAGTRTFPCQDPGCRCKCFYFVPSHGTWSVKCNCKHDPQEHIPAEPRKCGKCACGGFNSSYACTCGGSFMQHKTLFETPSERAREGRSTSMTFSSLAPPPDNALPGSSGMNFLEDGGSSSSSSSSSRSGGGGGGGGYHGPSAYELMMQPHSLSFSGGYSPSSSDMSSSPSIRARSPIGKAKARTFKK